MAATRDTVLSFIKLIGNRLSSDFRSATSIVRAEIDLRSLKPNQIVVRNHFVGINASDINFTAGRYHQGALNPPYDTGFEAISEVVAVGSTVQQLSVGDPVGVTSYGAFSEYQVVSPRACVKLPSLSPRYLPLFVSGLTASISLEKVGEIKSGETVVVTAAAGATGTFAVQLAKTAGCHVVGTCSSDSKVDYLRQLGCDRVVNTSKEDLKKVLKSEYPKGIDVVYESIGGEIFDACLSSIAVKGRLIIIGFISGYADQSGWKETEKDNKISASKVPFHVRLLAKSASIRGFFLNDFPEERVPHLNRLIKSLETGQLKSALDPQCESGAFKGVSSIPDAIDFLYSRKNIGKVFVQLSSSTAKL